MNADTAPTNKMRLNGGSAHDASDLWPLRASFAIEPLATPGAKFQLRTEAPTTVGATLGAGSEWRIAGRTSLGFGVSYSHTFSKYRVTEVRSGATGTISPFAPLGVGTQLIGRW